MKWIDRFQVLDGTGDTEAIFAGCWLKVRCHLVHAGRFYMCTRPPHLDSPEDGLVLDDAPDLLSRAHAYLTRAQPLAACARCLGASGQLVPHTQLRRKGSGLAAPPTSP